MTRPRDDQRMVERGAQVDEYEGGSEYGATCDHPVRSAHRCGDEIGSSDKGKDEAYAVRDCIGENVAQLEFGWHISMIAAPGMATRELLLWCRDVMDGGCGDARLIRLGDGFAACNG